MAQRPGQGVPGAFTLSLLVAPHTMPVLRSLDAAGPASMPELAERVGAEPAELRPVLADLRKLDSVRRKGSGLATRYSLTPAGSELLELGRSALSTFGQAPGGSGEPGAERAREAVADLIAGVESGVFDALADGPATLDEITARISGRRFS